MVQFDLLLPRHTLGDLPFFSFLGGVFPTLRHVKRDNFLPLSI